MSMNLTNIASGAQEAVNMFGYGVCRLTYRFFEGRVFYAGGSCTDNQKGYALIGAYIIATLLIMRTCCKCVFSGRKVQQRNFVALDTADAKAQDTIAAFTTRNSIRK